MRRRYLSAGFAWLVAAALVSTPVLAQSTSSGSSSMSSSSTHSSKSPHGLNDKFVGRVDHVSVNNIKVTNPRNHKTLSFLLVPHFGKVFDSKGKSRAMKEVKPGTMVTVYYDQKALGARHADRIEIMNSGKTLKD